jgi:DNA-binding MarR family transcriptional regulator
MGLDDSKKSIAKLFLHDKPFLLLKAISESRQPVYATMISKKIDCSYAYIVRLIKIMNKLGLIDFEGSNHKKILNLTPKGKKIFKALFELEH